MQVNIRKEKTNFDRKLNRKKSEKVKESEWTSKEILNESRKVDKNDRKSERPIYKSR